MSRSSTVLALWTLFVWGTRIRNAVRDDDGVGPILVSLAFVGLALLVLGTRGSNGLLITILGGLTVLVWVVRAVDIALLSDHGAAFIAVHLAIAAVSVVLAGWAIRSARAPTPVVAPG